MTSKKQKLTGKTSKRGAGFTTKRYETFLDEELRNPKEAAAYLSRSLDDEDPAVFLLALKDVARVHGGLGTLARKASLSRESLYRTLSEKGNPELYSLDAILRALGFKLRVETTQKA